MLDPAEGERIALAIVATLARVGADDDASLMAAAETTPARLRVVTRRLISRGLLRALPPDERGGCWVYTLGPAARKALVALVRKNTSGASA